MKSGVTNARLATGFGMERATPHKLTLCVLIRLYVSPAECVAERNCKLTFTQVKDLQIFLVQAIHRVDDILEPVLSQTCDEIVAGISNGRTVANYLRDVLQEVDSPDSLFDLLQSLRELLSPTTALFSNPDINLCGRPTNIEPSSIFGVFLRRVLVSCKRSFEALSRLFHDIGLYRKATSNGSSIPLIVPRQKPGSLKRKMSTSSMEDLNSSEQVSNQREGQQASVESSTSRELRRRSSSMQDTTRLGKEEGGKEMGDNVNSNKTFRSFVSRRQLQFHLHRMVEELEGKIGKVSPQEVEREISEMLAVSPDLPRAHFVRYMNCLLHREYQGAVDSLHTYFDYCMRGGGPTSSAAIATASAAAVAASGGRSTHGAAAIHAAAALGRRRPMMQYAVLNLAALHFQFGHRREAMLAIQETVRVAQQNGDHVCVVFALSWLFRLASSHGGQETSQLLRRCLNRAQELGLHHVQGLSYLATAQYRLLAPSSVPTAMPPPVQGFNAFAAQKAAPALSVWESIDRAVDASVNSIGSYVDSITNAIGSGQGQRGSLQNRNQAAMQNNEDYATGMPDQSSRFAMSQAIKMVNASLATPSSLQAGTVTITGRSQLLQSVAWESFGHTSLAWLSAFTHLNYYAGRPGTSATDTCLAVCRLACTQAELGTLDALCPGLPSLSRSQKNSYIGALLLLLDAKKTYKYHVNNIIVQTFVYLLQSRAIARGDVLESLILASTIRSLTPAQQSVFGIGGSYFSDGLALSAQSQWIDALRMMGRLSEAHSLTHLLISKSCGVNLHYMQENLDLTLAQIFLDSGFSAVTALPYTLRCISRTEKNGQETLYNAASIKLATCQLLMGHVSRAYKILLQALPHTAAHGTLRMRGEVQLLLAKCHIAFCSTENTDAVFHLDSAQASLRKAFDMFSEACLMSELQEVLYLLARVHNQLATMLEGKSKEKYQLNIQARDIASRHFLSLRDKQSRPVVRLVGYLENDDILMQVACS